MIERAYTVTELDELRRACRNRLTWGNSLGAQFLPGETFKMGHGCSESSVEEFVRTHMMAGHVAEDLYLADKPS